MTKVAPKLGVELYVCPEPGCNHVGKVVGFNGAAFCVGDIKDRHPRRQMKLRKFQEVK